MSGSPVVLRVHRASGGVAARLVLLEPARVVVQIVERAVGRRAGRWRTAALRATALRDRAAIRPIRRALRRSALRCARALAVGAALRPVAIAAAAAARRG